MVRFSGRVCGGVWLRRSGKWSSIMLVVGIELMWRGERTELNHISHSRYIPA